MLDHDPLTPEEAQDQNLIQALSRYYETRAEDSASLARMRARLLQKTAASLPVTDDGRRDQSPVLLQTRREKNTRMQFVHAFAQNLQTLVAVVLLVVLVGSFVLALHLRQGTTAGSKPPGIAHSWSLVAKFHGTGNQTITGQNIEVGHKYGWLINCTNTSSGLVSLKLNGQDAGSAACFAKATELLRPEASLTSPEAFAPVHTIEVIVAASTSWELLLFKGTYYPPLSIETPDWHALHDEIDGTGNESWLVDILLPGTWELQFVCHGTGDFKMSLRSDAQSNTPDIATANAQCNGRTITYLFDKVGHGMTVHQVQITTGADNDWQAVLVGCTTGKPSCGITTATPTPTP